VDPPPQLCEPCSVLATNCPSGDTGASNLYSAPPVKDVHHLAIWQVWKNIGMPLRKQAYLASLVCATLGAGPIVHNISPSKVRNHLQVVEDGGIV
jgi:hypothetical protein